MNDTPPIDSSNLEAEYEKFCQQFSQNGLFLHQLKTAGQSTLRRRRKTSIQEGDIEDTTHTVAQNIFASANATHQEDSKKSSIASTSSGSTSSQDALPLIDSFPFGVLPTTSTSSTSSDEVEQDEEVKAAKRASARSFILKEIYTTEFAFLNSLSKFLVFLTGAQCFLPERDFQALNRQLTLILQKGGSFSARLKSISSAEAQGDHQQELTVVANAFLSEDFDRYWDALSIMAMSFLKYSALFLHLQTTNNAYNVYANTPKQKDLCQKQPPDAFLSRPFQRVQKYHLFLKDLLKHMSESPPQYGDIKRALEKVQTLADKLDQKGNQNPNFAQLPQYMLQFEQHRKTIPVDDRSESDQIISVCEVGTSKMKETHEKKLSTLLTKLSTAATTATIEEIFPILQKLYALEINRIVTIGKELLKQFPIKGKKQEATEKMKTELETLVNNVQALQEPTVS